VKGPGDTTNFESYPESGEDRSAPLTPAQQAEFKNF
jgi:protein kinase A